MYFLDKAIPIRINSIGKHVVAWVNSSINLEQHTLTLTTNQIAYKRRMVIVRPTTPKYACHIQRE